MHVVEDRSPGPKLAAVPQRQLDKIISPDVLEGTTDFQTGYLIGVNETSLNRWCVKLIDKFSKQAARIQQKPAELHATCKVLVTRKRPSNLLVFGVGHDSALWHEMNAGGRTVFLEDNREWLKLVKKQFPTFEMYLVEYPVQGKASKERSLQVARNYSLTRCRFHHTVYRSECILTVGLPKEIWYVDWDVIMVDAPSSLGATRMSSIYTAALLARNRAQPGPVDIFVHDMHRIIEQEFSKEYLCNDNLVQCICKPFHVGVRGTWKLAHFFFNPERERLRTAC